VLLAPGPVTSFRLFRHKRNLRAISEYHRATTLLEANGFGRTVEFRIPRARQPWKVFVKSTPPTWSANATLSQEQFQSSLNLTNRFHVAVRLFSNRSQMTSKCGKNKKVTHEAISERVTDVLTTFLRPLWSITESDARQHGIYLFYTIIKKNIQLKLFISNSFSITRKPAFAHFSKHDKKPFDVICGLYKTKRLGGKRGAGGPGVWKTRGLVENAGSGGKRGVWWKTRGLVENAESSGKRGVRFFSHKIRIFLTKMRSQNFVCLYWDEYQFSITAWNAFLDQKSKSNISWERKPFKSQRVVHWFSFGGLFYFSQQLVFQSFSFEKEITNVLTVSLVSFLVQFFKQEVFFADFENGS